MSSSVRVGIDIGGTFTDFVVYEPSTNQLKTFKVLSTPRDPAQAVITGLRQAGLLPPPAGARLEIMHGSTVATNALLERKGARMALVATQGFGDILQIGRQNRPELYNLKVRLPAPLVPPELRFEVNERVSAEGKVLQPLQPAGLDALVGQVSAAGVESVAVCLLFSFLQPHHEQLIATALRRLGLFVSASCEILPEYREFERMSTTAINAYVSPVLDRYLGSLEQALQAGAAGEPVSLQIMQSNGGVIALPEARRNGVHCILSGPAGGVVGAQKIGLARASLERQAPEAQGLKLLTFDMGGTSTDVALIDGAPRLTNESSISGVPIRIPVLDIHTIGAGGGSIAAVDQGGALRVGPESAGADPGPACYGLGASQAALFATVTDANLLLGRLGEPYFLDGSMPLHSDRAERPLGALATQLGLSVIVTALGIVEVANAHMERALRVISVERGHDPRDFTLLSFGGAGGLHAADLARGLGIPQVLFPPLASTLSALGMVVSQVIKDYSQTVMLTGRAAPETLQAGLQPLRQHAQEELRHEGVEACLAAFQPSLDMRYAGQSFELNIPWPDPQADFLQAFHQAHQLVYGYANETAPVEIVNLRLRASGPPPEIQLPISPEPARPSRPPQPYKHQAVCWRGPDGEPTAYQAACYHWADLRPGDRVQGPALVVRSDTTILVGRHDAGVVDAFLNLVVTAVPAESN